MPLKTYFLCCVLFSFSAFAQEEPQPDTIKGLQEVVVKAFEQNRQFRNLPAAVGYINRQALDRFTPVSIVSAVNTMPGVRMEERSPGSYRFNIRGSSLRSPFGVRNVKVYYNDIPFTDPGGQTYLNSLGAYNFNSVEVIKGPASSLYGAGTGGVLLIESLGPSERPGFTAEYTAGSYNQHNLYGAVTTRSERLISRTSYQRQQSKGYRKHSELQRDVLSWSGLFQWTEKKQLRTSFVYSDLFYETPGALTKAEYDRDPRAARPGSGAFPGSEAARAAIYQKTFLAGASYTQQFTSKLQSKTALYGAFNQLHNPTLRNYGRSSEPHVGGRGVLTFRQPLAKGQFSINAGTEWQQGFATVSIHGNRGGTSDTVQTYDEVTNRQSLAFVQAVLDMADWTLTAGTSINTLRVKFRRFVPRPLPEQGRKIDNEVVPRFSLSRKWGQLFIYTSTAKGFSPPTTAELLPTGSSINLGLNAEQGTNYDAGVRGNFPSGWNFDVNVFTFHLKNTVVQRRDAGGGEYFINAGRTRQRGVETYLSYSLFQNKPSVENSLVWLSHTWHRFRYHDFKQVNSDFSGNRLPGVAPHTIASGIDVQTRKGWFGHITYYFSDKIPLNDANDAFADAYHLIGFKAGYQKDIGTHWRIRAAAGADNLLDEKYSLGNDINGFGGRYYNGAPERNFFISLLLQWTK